MQASWAEEGQLRLQQVHHDVAVGARVRGVEFRDVGLLLLEDLFLKLRAAGLEVLDLIVQLLGPLAYGRLQPSDLWADARG